MATTRETVRLLCKSIITRLENQKSISFPPRLRQVVQDEVAGLIGPFVLTDEDLRERTLAKIGARADILAESGFTDSEQYKTAKALVRATFGDDVLHGLFFQKPIRTIAITIAEYLMRSSHIDDVYETDEDMERLIVEMVQKFSPENMH